MHSRSTHTRVTLAIAIVTAGAVLAGCKPANYAKTDTTAAGEVVRKDSLADTTRNPANPASPANPSSAVAPNNNGWTDAQILAYTRAADSAEIAEGRLAERKATNPAAK